jgi:hypothetical protein
MAPKRARAPPAGYAWGVGPFRAGEAVRYWDAAAGEVRDAALQRVDASVQPPSYAVLLRGGQTRDTEAARLARVEASGEDETGGGDAAAGASAAERRSPRRSGAGAAGAGGAATTPRRTPRRGAAAAAAEDPSPKRARSSQAHEDPSSPRLHGQVPAGRLRRGRSSGAAAAAAAAAAEEDSDEGDEQPRSGAMGLVHIVATAMAVTTAALAALRRL